eukprot:Mycagemm_TRINITY_DN6066_c0_g1::TRINITY_DN6066_c0_g1_i1::g.4665::m.4665 type:complete len:212 gc:universal TRINITY_DN6066_c0_g1_i1:67-702(+)
MATTEKAAAPAEPTKEKTPAKDEDAEEDDSDDEMPALENAGAGAEGESKHSRAEKKSRKAMAKLGMKPVSGISRVTIKKSKSILFVIQRPEVFKSPASDTYIIFGEAKVEDISQSLGQNALQALQAQAAAAAEVKGATPVATGADAAAPAAAKPAATPAASDNEVVDETGVESKDIELVMSQTQATRARAVKALKNHNNDIVEAIIELTVS